jgi:signal transduction histidine kinase/ligand-binding sensor domain-containing protein/DNA-binding response OmpR family regulator
MKHLRHLLTLFLALIATTSSWAISGVLYSADKLSSSMVDYIVQDHYGYLWVGTQFGLNRFDGYRFTQFFTDKNDTTSLQNNDVSRLLIDSKKRLWVGGDKGLCQFDYERNCFIRYKFPNDLIPRVECLFEDTDGNLLIGTAGYGLFSIRAGKNVITDEPQLSNTNGADFYMVGFEDDQHNLWRGRQNSVITRNKVSNLKPTATKDFESPYGPVVTFIKNDRRGFLAICLYGILRYDYASGKLEDAGYDLSAFSGKVSIRTALVDHEGNIYVGTSGNGLFVIPKNTMTLKKVEFDRFGLATSNINYIFEDKDHNIWVSCYKKGLIEINQGREAFSTWKFAAQNYILGSSVSSIAEGDNGGVWCTIQKSMVYHFDKDGKITPAVASPEGANCIYRDRQGHYWLGSENTLYSYNPVTGSSTPKLKVDGWGINCMADDGDGHLYVCNYGKGISVLNTVTGESYQLSMFNNDPQKGHLSNDWVKAMLIDSRGLLWLATMNGVCVMNPADRNFKFFGWEVQLKGQKCFSLSEQREGVVLIGTESGLYYYDRESNKVALYPGSEEIENIPIYSIISSRSGNLWISSTMGIWQYNQEKKRFVNHVNGNGLQTREFILGAVVHATDDRIFYGSNEGIVAFYPDDVRSGMNYKGRKVFLTNFFLDGKNVSCLTDRFYIPYDHNSFSMEFSLLNFQDVGNITYEYRLNDGEWTGLPEGTNNISFSRMKPGKYVVEVRVMGNENDEASNCQVTFVVRSPWYASTWAYLIYILLALGIMAFVAYYMERKRKADLDEQKMKFLINATHDIRSPLSLILGPLNKLKERVTDAESVEDIEIIDRNAQRLLLLVNQILDERKIDKQQMHLHCNETDLVKFIAGICSLFQFSAKQRDIRFSFHHEDEKLMAWIDTIQFDKVISNLLSNAFKYTPDGGEIVVVLRKEGKQAFIQVLDTGVGLKEEDTNRLFERFYQGKNAQGVQYQGTGIGLNLSKAIVQMHGGQIKAYNRKDGLQGSCFDVCIPLGKDHLKPEEIEVATKEFHTDKKRQTSRNLRLLVVDDDQEVAHYIKNELGYWYRVDTAPNGKEALKMLLTNDAYDLVISDVMMPEMDGITMLRQLKSNVNISDIPVILLTSKIEVEDRLEGLKKGADAYLAKPFNMEELHILVDNLVDNVRRLRGKYSGAQQQKDKVENVELKGNNDVLMERVMKTINEHMQDPDFTIDKLTEEVGLSRTQLHRKMKEITGISTGEFIRNLRLEQAARLIRQGKVNVSQVAYSVGFNNQTYFSTVFKKHFGVTPTEYAENASEDKPVS